MLFKKVADMFKNGETTEFSGKVIVALAQDKQIMKYSRKTVIAADYAHAHNIRDIDNRVIDSFRQLNLALATALPSSLQFITNFIPNFIKVPQFILDIVNSKF
jgi:dehydrogenase/reductase SDR family member 1